MKADLKGSSTEDFRAAEGSHFNNNSLGKDKRNKLGINKKSRLWCK